MIARIVFFIRKFLLIATDFPLMNGTSYPKAEPSSPQFADEKGKFLPNLNNIQKDTAKEQLICLANKFGYEVQIDDFPKVSDRHSFEPYLFIVICIPRHVQLHRLGARFSDLICCSKLVEWRNGRKD